MCAWVPGRAQPPGGSVCAVPLHHLPCRLSLPPTLHVLILKPSVLVHLAHRTSFSIKAQSGARFLLSHGCSVRASLWRNLLYFKTTGRNYYFSCPPTLYIPTLTHSHFHVHISHMQSYTLMHTKTHSHTHTLLVPFRFSVSHAHIHLLHTLTHSHTRIYTPTPLYTDAPTNSHRHRCGPTNYNTP